MDSTLVYLCGLACDPALYEPVWARLSDALRPPRALCLDVHARADAVPDMAALLLAETTGPLALVGTSLGGMVALHAALAAPDRVRSLALLGTTARPDPPAMVFLRQEAIRLFRQGRMDDVLRANLPSAFHPAHRQDEALVAAYLAMVRRAGVDALVRQNQAVMRRPDLRPRLGAIACPTLLLVGEADALTPHECSLEIAQAVSGARCAPIAQAGHMLTLEAPVAVAQALQDWLAPAAGTT